MPDNELPYVIEASSDDADLPAWIKDNGDTIKERLNREGAILFRGFNIDTPDALQGAIEAASPGNLWDYGFALSPRSQVGDAVFTSTDAPPQMSIMLHPEFAYGSRWPRKIWFACALPAKSGGETPIGDNRKILARLAPELRDEFDRRGLLYIRKFPADGPYSWSRFLLTEDREEAEGHCRSSGFDFEWGADGTLMTKRKSHAIIRHPETGESVWFNQLQLYHSSALGYLEGPASALGRHEDQEPPGNVLYGDGVEIADDVVAHVREAHNEESVFFKWQKGDAMLLDNILVAHGRRRFVGERKILTGMAEPMTESELADSPQPATSLTSQGSAADK